MKNALTSISIIGILAFVLMLFPFAQDFNKELQSDFNEKKDTVVEEYERVKGTVTDFTAKAKETKDRVESLLSSINETIDSVQETSEKVNEVFDLREDAAEDAENADEGDVEGWRYSDPAVDISIAAGRSNYNLADPGADNLSEDHLKVDIKPWIEWGSSSEDKSTKAQRINVLATTDLGRAMLDELGYEYY